MIRSIALLALALPMIGCQALTAGSGSNLATAGYQRSNAGCGAINVAAGGTGNGGLCLTPPGMIGSSTVNPNGSIVITVTGWAFNPLVDGTQPNGKVIPVTPAQPLAPVAGAVAVPTS